MPTAECTGCRAKYRAPDQLAGKTLKCKKCGSPVKVPAAPAAEFADDGGSALASALDSMQPRQDPPPARPQAKEQDAFSALLNQIDAEQDSDAAPAAGGGAWGANKKQKKPKKAKAPKGQPVAAGGGEINPFVGGGGVAMPRQAPVSPERFGRDDTSMMLFMIAGVVSVLLMIYQLFMAYQGYDDAVAAEIAKYESMGMTIDRSKVPGFPLGKALLGFLLGLAVFFCIAVPYNMIGVLITSKIMKFQLVGSKYVNTLGWLSVPNVVGAIGFLLAGQMGFGIAYLVGFLLTLPAFGFLHGLRMLETIVGYLITIVLWAVPIVGIIMLAFALAAARGTAEGMLAEREARVAEQQQAMTADTQSNTTDPANNTRTRPSGTPAPEQPPAVPLTPFEQAMADLSSSSSVTFSKGASALNAMDLDPAQQQQASAALKGILDQESTYTSRYAAALQAGIDWEIDGLDNYLLKAAQRGSGDASTLATQTLTQRQDPRVVPFLLDKLRSQPQNKAVIESFGKAAGPAVLEKLNATSSIFDQRDLLPLLKAVGTEEAVPTLKTLATDRNDDVAAAAREAWLAIAPQTYEPVRLAMADLNANNQAMAIQALKSAEVDPQFSPTVNEKLLEFATSYQAREHFDDLAEAWQPWADGVIKAKLRGYLNDERSSTYERRAGLELFSRWQDEDALDDIQKWVIKEPDLAVEALSRYGDKAIVPMAQLLSNRNEDIVAAACKVLGNVGGARDIARLQGVTRRTSNQPKAASAAEIAIAQIEAREAQNATTP